MTASTRRRKGPLPALSLSGLLLISSLATTVACPAPAFCEGGQKLSGYELDQETSFNGKYRVVACPNAVRLDHIIYGWSLISTAPKWDVFVFRQDSKEYSQVPYKEWLRANTILVTTIWTMELKKPLSAKGFKKDGLSYITYLFPSTSADSTFMRSAGVEEAKAMENNRGEIICLDFPPDIHVGGIVGRACELPELQGIAVQATRRSARTSAWTLKTIKTKRNDNISPDLFVLPKGLKKVPFNRQMFSSSTAKDSINFMLGDPDK